MIGSYYRYMPNSILVNKSISKSRPHFSGLPAFLKLTPKRPVIGILLDQCSKQKFSSSLVFLKIAVSTKKVMCSQNFVLVGERFQSENSLFTGFDKKKSYLWLDINFVSPCKKPFSNHYLSLLEQKFENKLPIHRLPNFWQSTLYS